LYSRDRPHEVCGFEAPNLDLVKAHVGLTAAFVVDVSNEDIARCEILQIELMPHSSSRIREYICTCVNCVEAVERMESLKYSRGDIFDFLPVQPHPV
jgi:hypothetical protein